MKCRSFIFNFNMIRFLVKACLFIVLIVFAQQFIGRFAPYPAPDSVNNLLEYQKKKVNIIYFGDSTIIWWGIHEVDHRSVSNMLSSAIKKQVGQVTHNSYHANMYDEYTSFMSAKRYYPAYVIIPINLRSFSPEWDLRSTSQFTDESLYLHLTDTPFSPFLSFIVNLTLPDAKRTYDNIYDLSPVFDGNKLIGNGLMFESLMKPETPDAVRLPAMLQMYYLGSLSPDHRKLHALSNIADKYRNTKTKVIFYITPIDYQTGEKYFGKHFDTQVKHNTSLISSELNKHGATVLDLSYALKTNYFIWHEAWYINEHLNSKGRQYIATQVAKEVNNSPF